MSVYVIAEAGVNHNGSLDRALALVDAAAATGANAVKFQTFSAKKLANATAPKAAYQKRLTDAAESQQAMLAALELDHAAHVALKSRAAERGIDFLSSPFDADSLAMLIGLGVPAIKLPSGELTNLPLLWQFGRAKLPLIVSTGMATLEEVRLALATLCHARTSDTAPEGRANLETAWKASGTAPLADVTLLHCTSHYPTSFDEVNLRAMDTLARTFGLPVGYSDHTEGILIPVAAVARGAVMIEKHLTLDRTLSGPDHQASLEPDEMTQMIRDIRALETALGDGIKAPQPSEQDTAIVARQRLIASRPIARGEPFTAGNVVTARTGHGRLAADYWDILGQAAPRNYEAGEVLE